MIRCSVHGQGAVGRHESLDWSEDNKDSASIFLTLTCDFVRIRVPMMEFRSLESWVSKSDISYN